MTLFATSILVAILVVAAIWDVRFRRIPDALTALGVVAGLGLRVPGGMDVFATGVLGLVAGFAFGAVFFVVGGMGGGDVKLMAVVGAFLGLPALGYTLLVTAVVGGVMAFGAALRHGALVDTIVRAGGLVLSPFGVGRGSRRTITTPGALTIPYGVAIAVGGLYGWFGHAL